MLVVWHEPNCHCEECRTDEAASVERWRLQTLLDAGYPLPLAEKIATSTADLHRAVELVRDGCKYATAAEILT